MSYTPDYVFDISQHYSADEIADVSGGTSANYYLSAETYTGGMIDFILASSPTIKIHTSCEDVAAGDDVGQYFDRTSELASGATITTSETVNLLPDVIAGATWIKIEVTDSGDWKILANRLWR